MPLINTGDSIQAAVTANPNGTSFCLASGVHEFGSGKPNTGSVTPKVGNIFTGQFGAILEGEDWSSVDLDDAFFRGVNNGITGVTIRNILMRNGPSYGVNAYLSAASWLVNHCEIHHCRNGVSVGEDGVISNNFIHHNEGIRNDPNPSLRGGGIVTNSSSGVQVIDNEVSYNGQEQKFIYGTGGVPNQSLYIARNFYHHNVADGIWIDGDGSGSTIEDNVVEDNGRTGITLELGSNVIVQNNFIRRHVGGEGILLSAARDCTLSGNAVEDNLFGIGLYLDFARLAETYPFWTVDLTSNAIFENTILVPAGAGNFASMFTYTGAGSSTPYVNNAKGNNFIDNVYASYTPAGSIFTWGNTNKTFAQWQGAILQDVGGSMSSR